jgi:transmembrane sensor
LTVHERLTYLLRQVMLHAATAEELTELSDLVKADHTGEYSQYIAAQLQADLLQSAPVQDASYWDGLADQILAADHPDRVKVHRMPAGRHLRRIAAAAAVLVLAAGLSWFLYPKKPTPVLVKKSLINDVLPGGNKATLILADGAEIQLDSAGNGALAQQGSTRVVKSGSGLLAYESHHGGEARPAGNGYNTLRTPRGGQFQVTLPDGSKVWLNAASSLRFPTTFTGPSREVELSGEAYFEVAQNAAQPFRVHLNGIEVQVLGTRFNIMAYEEEALLTTTLLQGAVKVSSGRQVQQLAPGQGASLHRNNGELTVAENANTEQAVAWKNGWMQLEGDDIRSVMRDIARWYDVEVIYTADVPAHFRGVIPRNVNVTEVLKKLELTGEVHFTVKGKQIIVSP